MPAISLPTPVVTIGDHGGDPDDEYLLVALAAYQRLGLVDLRAVWPTSTRRRRARLWLRARAASSA